MMLPKQRLLTEDLTRIAYLHIATHGLIDEEDPARSALVLSRLDKQGRPIDGYLSMKELAELDLGARLVVLSACQTASGRELRGEGMLRPLPRIHECRRIAGDRQPMGGA